METPITYTDVRHLLSGAEDRQRTYLRLAADSGLDCARELLDEYEAGLISRYGFEFRCQRALGVEV